MQKEASYGYPLGRRYVSLSSGVISCLSRTVSVAGVSMTVMQTDAPVNHGNSGGGMFDMAGNLIGIVCAKSSGDGIEGLGFVIPMSVVWSVAQDILHYGYVPNRPDLGMQLTEVQSPSVLSGSSTYLRIDSYAHNSELSAAQKLEAGDILETVNGKTVTSRTDLHGAMAGLKIGERVTVTVLRSVTSTVAGRPVTTQKRITLSLQVYAYTLPALS